MTDMDVFRQILEKDNVGFHTTILYSTEDNSFCGWAVWLDKGGHAEFNRDKQLTNVVNY